MIIMRLFFIFIFFNIAIFLNAKEDISPIKVGVAFAPIVSAKLSDPVPMFVKRIGEISNKNLSIKIYPFSRSANFNNSKMDMQIPFIYTPSLDKKELPFIFSSATLWKINFILYTNKNKDIDLSDLNKLNLITDTAHVNLFDFKIKGIFNIEGAIRMVDRNRVDGLIFADVVVNAIIKKHNLKNIKRTFFKEYDVKALIFKNSRMEEVDKMISYSLDKMRSSGELSKIKESWSIYIE